MFKDLSPKYYQNNKEKLEKRFMKDTKVFLKEKSKRKTNKKQKIVEYTKTYYKMRKRIYYNYKKRFSFGIKLLGKHGKFIYFLSAFRKFAMLTKSTVLPYYENFYA